MPKYLIIIVNFLLYFFSPEISCSDFFLKIKNEKTKKIAIDQHGKNNNISPGISQEVYYETLTTSSGLQVPITFYNRNSDTLLVAGQALPAPKEVMEIYANLFDKYDIILFDYRWNQKYCWFLINSVLKGRPVQKILLDEVEEINSVLAFAKNQKFYKKLVGLGECYSSFLFAKLQADEIKTHGAGPFTHLILDSCWHSLKLFAEQICADPFLPISPQKGGAPKLIKALTNNKFFKWLSLKVAFTLIRDISIEPYLQALNMPILFIHGRNDLFVPKEHFKKIWKAVDPEFRAIFFTPYQHCNNIKNKGIYRYIAEQFIDTKISELS